MDNIKYCPFFFCLIYKCSSRSCANLFAFDRIKATLASRASANVSGALAAVLRNLVTVLVV